MTDAEMIDWLRSRTQHRTPYSGTFVMRLHEIANRLEQLAVPSERSPLTPEREAEIRRLLNHWTIEDRGSDLGDELLAALDHQCAARIGVECMMQDQQQESGLFEAGQRAVLARALAWISEHVASPVAENMRLGLIGECGPAQLPPHAVTHARMKRLEAALVEIAGMNGFGDGGMPKVMQIARKALEQS